MAKFHTWVSRAFLCFVVAGFTLVAASAPMEMVDHIEYTLSNLRNSKYIMPSTDDGSALKVTVGITPIRFLSIENNILTLLVFESVEWTDNRLKPFRPMNISDEFSLPAHLIWTPDLEYYTVTTPPELLNQQDNVIITVDGKVNHVLFKKITSPCFESANSTYSCSIKIGSWSHFHNDLELNYKTEDVQMDYAYMFIDDAQWNMEDASVKRNIFNYRCCPEVYSDVTYSMTLKRNLKA